VTEAQAPIMASLHAYKTYENWTLDTLHRDEAVAEQRTEPSIPETVTETKSSDIASLQAEITHLRSLLAAYEQGRFIRFMRRVRKFLG